MIKKKVDESRVNKLIYCIKVEVTDFEQFLCRFERYISIIDKIKNIFDKCGIISSYQLINSNPIKFAPYLLSKRWLFMLQKQSQTDVVQKNGTFFCIKNAENGSKENQEITRTLRG